MNILGGNAIPRSSKEAHKMLINHIFWHYEENLAAIAEAGKTMPIHAVADGEEIEL